MSGADEARIASILERLTLAEKCELVGGVGLWRTGAVPRLGVPGLKVTDGPNGARGETGGDLSSACFPCGTSLAATWNVDLVTEVGAALGEEARSKGAHVLLAPTVNLHRSPTAGRNFECYSEDPHLSARMAVAFVRGVQSRGVATAVKHFACNDSEFERHSISSEVGDRALREIYLRPFEAAVCEGGAWGVMTAYNRLNGVYCSENAWLLRDVLKGEWGFDGFVVSDWGGTHDTAGIANGGLDLEMPGPPRHLGEKLARAVEGKQVAESVVDDMARRLLRAMARTGALDEARPRDEESRDDPAHRAIARRAAVESMVLLKNENATLPLDPARLRRIAVVGPAASRAQIQGGGSAQVNPHYVSQPLPALAERAGAGVEVVHARGCTNHRRTPPIDASQLAPAEPSGRAGWTLEYFRGFDLEGPAVLRRSTGRSVLRWLGDGPGDLGRAFSARLSARFVPELGGVHRFALASAGLSRLVLDGRPLVDNWTAQTPGDSFYGAGSSEVAAEAPLEAGREHDVVVEYSRRGAPFLGGIHVGCLPPQPDDPIGEAVACARAADVALVLVGLTDEWEGEGADRADLSLPGRQQELIERVAAANPRTVVLLNAGSPLAMDWIDAVPAVVQVGYAGQECGRALADLVFGDADFSGRLPTTIPRRLEDGPAHAGAPGADGRAVYDEGIFVGYRHYDRTGIEPRFPFGHGLSYATFRYGALRLSAKSIRPGETLSVEVDVTNEGSARAMEVVQLYLRDPVCRLPRPDRELVAFAKLDLAPGETGAARLEVGPRALSFFDPESSQWVAEPGDFELLAGSSSRDVRARATFALQDGAA